MKPAQECQHAQCTRSDTAFQGFRAFSSLISYCSNSGKRKQTKLSCHALRRCSCKLRLCWLAVQGLDEHMVSPMELLASLQGGRYNGGGCKPIILAKYALTIPHKTNLAPRP